MTIYYLRGNTIRLICVCVHGFVRAALCHTSMVHYYVVHHRPVLCIKYETLSYSVTSWHHVTLWCGIASWPPKSTNQCCGPNIKPCFIVWRHNIMWRYGVVSWHPRWSSFGAKGLRNNWHGRCMNAKAFSFIVNLHSSVDQWAIEWIWLKGNVVMILRSNEMMVSRVFMDQCWQD